MRASTNDPNQRGLFLEIIETRTTRDELVDDEDGGWHSRVCPPPGTGWKVVDFTRDRWTRWQRRRPVVWAPRRATRGGGGWLR